jgi:F-type H+-transporting ATPase subunit delta
MKRNSPRQFAVALYEATAGAKKDDIEHIVANFSAMLAKGRQLKLADKIIEELVSYAKEKDGLVRINITTATKMDEKIINSIKSVFGKKVETTENIDESILGGLIVRTKDVIFDASIKTQLIKLKKSLI